MERQRRVGGERENGEVEKSRRRQRERMER